MNKRLYKPHEKNVRLDEPCGLLGVPPDSAVKIYVPASAVVIVTDTRPVVRRKDTKLPQ